MSYKRAGPLLEVGDVGRPIRAICFPHAGGSTVPFLRLRKLVPKSLDVCPVLLPGRDRLLSEPPLRRMDALADSTAAALVPWLDRPYMLVGHSMGALAAFEVARRLQSAGIRPPSHLLVASQRGPELPSHRPSWHGLSDTEFVDAMQKRYGAIPAQVLAEPELLARFLPILRADVEILDTYRYEPKPPLATPITALVGRDDATVAPDRARAWASQSTLAFELRIIAGGHFIVAEQPQAFAAEMARCSAQPSAS